MIRFTKEQLHRIPQNAEAQPPAELNRFAESQSSWLRAPITT